MHVHFEIDARDDLVAIHDYLVARNPRAAERVVDAILQTADLLREFPLIGPGGRAYETRELRVVGQNYKLVYHLPDAFHVNIERILHTAQDWPPERP